jgi:acyl-CoA thioester hydrolase
MEYVFSHVLETRFRDCDAMGHVNNAVYLTYLEQARFAHWRALWRFRQADEVPDVPGVILARVEIDYKKPARDGERLEIRLAVPSIGRTSFTYAYEVVDSAGGIVALARSVQVMYDYGAGTPVLVPDTIRSMLREKL